MCVGMYFKCAVVFYILDPPIIDRGPQSQEVVSGDDVTLTCDARGNPAISYTWERVSRAN